MRAACVTPLWAAPFVFGAAGKGAVAAIGAFVVGAGGALGLVLGLVIPCAGGELSQDCTARGTPIVPATSISCAQSAPF